MRLRQIGIVVHPGRDVDAALGAVRNWASRHGVAVGQVPIAGQPRRVAEPVEPGDCDLLLALGGDGTTLAALRVAAPAARPVLGVACGSIGVLTSVPADLVPVALQQVGAGDWAPRRLPGLDISLDGADRVVAINDLAAIRDGTGQMITSIGVDGELYARTAGDGLVVATPVGSSAYTMAAGGPILAPEAEGMVVTPLAHHSGVAPPLVVGPESRLTMLVEPGFGGGRLELDGQRLPATAGEVTVTFRRAYVTLVTLTDQEPFLTGLRRRGLIVDAPRVLVRDAAAASSRPAD